MNSPAEDWVFAFQYAVAFAFVRLVSFPFEFMLFAANPNATLCCLIEKPRQPR